MVSGGYVRQVGFTFFICLLVGVLIALASHALHVPYEQGGALCGSMGVGAILAWRFRLASLAVVACGLIGLLGALLVMGVMR